MDEETKEKKSQYAYLDLLASTLTEHEKTLDQLIGKLDSVSKNLTRVEQPVEPEEQAKPELNAVKKSELETIVYIKMKINRPARELKEILESLKE